MNVLYGVPDVKEMHYRNIKLISVLSDYGCNTGDVKCHFYDCTLGVCMKYCIKDHIWIREPQMPEYLAAHLTGETT